MAKHKKGHSARRNPPEGGYAKSIGMLALGAVAAGAAGYGAAWAVSMSKQSEVVQDVILGLGGIVIGAIVGLAGTPGRGRQMLGTAIAAGPFAVATSRWIAYLKATPEQRAVIDAARTAPTTAAGVPLSPSTYLGWNAGYTALPAGVPLSPSTYTSMGVMAG